MNTATLIEASRQILPGAFSNQAADHLDPEHIADMGAAVPYEATRGVFPDGSGDNESPTDDLPESPDQLEPPDLEAADEVEASQRELGFEVFAFYASFHHAQPGGRWGIFYYAEGIRRLTVLLMRRVRLRRFEAEQAARKMLHAHEHYHFRFDVGALHDELALRKPLYLNYSRQVYSKVLFTSDCVEEALANRAMTRAKFWGEADASRKTREFVNCFCKSGPPGYCDFDSDLTMLKEKLLGQLRTGAAAGHWPGPETEWLAHATRQKCPEYLVRRPRLPAGRFLKVKTGGRIWIVHPTDVDGWPSSPHAHEYDRRQKLSLSTGVVFSMPNRKPVAKLRPKELAAVRREIACQRPKLKLPPITVHGLVSE